MFRKSINTTPWESFMSFFFLSQRGNYFIARHNLIIFPYDIITSHTLEFYNYMYTFLLSDLGVSVVK